MAGSCGHGVRTTLLLKRKHSALLRCCSDRVAVDGSARLVVRIQGAREACVCSGNGAQLAPRIGVATDLTPPDLSDAENTGSDGYAEDSGLHSGHGRICNCKPPGILAAACETGQSDERPDSDYDSEVDAITSRFTSHDLQHTWSRCCQRSFGSIHKARTGRAMCSFYATVGPWSRSSHLHRFVALDQL
jgi:hypothetical protein